MRKAARRVHSIKKHIRPQIILRGALKRSHALKENISDYVTTNPLKTTGFLALGMVALSSFLFGYLKRR